MDKERGRKTIELLLRMTQGIWISSRVIILNSGFCILIGIVEMSKVGLFASLLDKRKRYWPKNIKVKSTIADFANRDSGSVDA